MHCVQQKVEKRRDSEVQGAGPGHPYQAIRIGALGRRGPWKKGSLGGSSVGQAAPSQHISTDAQAHPRAQGETGPPEGHRVQGWGRYTGKQIHGSARSWVGHALGFGPIPRSLWHSEARASRVQGKWTVKDSK